MPHPPKSPDSSDLTLICGLRWPNGTERYYLSRRYPGCWDFWVLGHRKRKARQIFARLNEAGTDESQVAFEMLDFFLEKQRGLARPEEGGVLEGLLGEPEIQAVLELHLERGRQKYAETYGSMLGLMWEFMDEEDYDELMEKLAEGQEPEEPPARVLPFPPQDVEHGADGN